MRRSTCIWRHLPALSAIVLFACDTQAADLNGAWATDASVCSQVFEKSGNRTSFKPNAELYGGGILIDGNRAAGAFQKCNIKSMKDDGANVRLIAACSTGVMSSDLEFTVKVLGANQITVISNGSVSAETSYVRCSL